MFASSVDRLRRAGHTDEAPVVLSIDMNTESFASLWAAEQEMERALDLPCTVSPTAEYAPQR